MKKPLIKVSDDVLQENPFRKGDFCDENNVPLHGVYTRKSEYEGEEEKLFISNGHLLSIYEYPIIKRTFHSPLVNDYNLNFCGEWSCNSVSYSECLTRVISGKNQ